MMLITKLLPHLHTLHEMIIEPCEHFQTTTNACGNPEKHEKPIIFSTTNASTRESKKLSNIGRGSLFDTYLQTPVDN